MHIRDTSVQGHEMLGGTYISAGLSSRIYSTYLSAGPLRGRIYI
jgi:hypothetical protein